MRKTLASSIAILSLLQAAPALADASCGGTIVASYSTIDGKVMIIGSWRNDVTQLCNIKTEWKGVTPDVCALWAAKADAAISSGRSLSVYYFGPFNCATIPFYEESPAPYYVTLL